MKKTTTYIMAILALSLLYSVTVTAHSTDQKFEELIKQKSFKVKMSHDNLANLHEASTLLISCVDFRLRDETEQLMRKNLNLLDRYDEVSLPGASLAIANSKYPHWVKTGKDAISILKSLHHIKRVIFLDHRSCGAYNLMLGKENLDTREKETAAHAKILAEAMKEVKDQFPDMEVYSLLMGLDGVVENLTPLEHKH